MHVVVKYVIDVFKDNVVIEYGEQGESVSFEPPNIHCSYLQFFASA